MEKRIIQFSPPDITEREAEEVKKALLSGWITTGPRTKELEKKLAAYCHTNKVVCLNSATAAEELNLRMLGVGEGDEVIVPAYTYTATASAVIHCGAKVVFVDSQVDNPEMDYDKVSDAITEKTKAIGKSDPNLRKKLNKRIRLPFVTDKFIPEEDYKCAVDMLDFVLYLYPKDSYKFTASGAIFEALSRGKPIISLRNAYFDYVFQKIGANFGYICEDVNGMCKQIQKLDQLSVEEYRKVRLANGNRRRRIRQPTRSW